MLISHTSWAASWTNQSYSRYAKDEAVAEILTDLGSRSGLPVYVSPQIQSNYTGYFKDQRILDVLTYLNETYSVVWYNDEVRLYFYDASEMTTRTFNFSISSEELLQALSEAGIYEDRFPWQTVGSTSMVRVSGPPAYLEAIEKFIGAYTSMLDKDHRGRKITKLVPLKYARVSNKSMQVRGKSYEVTGIAETLKNLLQTEMQNVEGGSPISPNAIRVHPQKNALIFFDTPENIEHYESVLRLIDTQESQIAIDVTIVDVSIENAEQLSSVWSVLTGSVEATLGGTSGADITSNLKGGIVFEGSETKQLMNRVQLLSKSGQVQVVSQPKIITLNNAKAVIDNKSTFFIELEGVEAVDLKEISVGSLLVVSPHIVEDGNVNTKIFLDVEIEDGTITADAVDGIPVLQSSNITTQAYVGNKSSLIVGGYFFDQVDSGSTGIPGLEKIPLVGSLFKSSTKTRSKRTRIFVITPSIIDGDAEFVTKSEDVKKLTDHVLSSEVRPTYRSDAKTFLEIIE
ncbi:MAG: type III secretion system outer membrane ring subunit SctC [Pseudomonadota bacterium]